MANSIHHILLCSLILASMYLRECTSIALDCKRMSSTSVIRTEVSREVAGSANALISKLSEMGPGASHTHCTTRSSTLHLRGGKLHPSLYPWLLSGHTKVDYYVSLGVSHEATAEEIRLAYKALVLSHHPDRKRQGGGEDGASDDRFIAVREAWEVLGDEDARRAYDLYLLEEQEREEAQANAWTGGAPDASQAQGSQSVSASFSFGSKNRYGFF